jgi:hypothetical protein
MLELYNPFLWSAPVKQVWLMKEAGIQPKLINSLPTIYLVHVLNYDRGDENLIWMLSTKGRWSVAVPRVTDSDFDKCLDALRAEGDKFFKGRVEINHDLVLAHIKALAR